jgi:deoxyribodipyrimidine photo-lyase
VTADSRGQKTSEVLEFVKKHDISHVYADMEYEVDELRRDIDLAKKLESEKEISLDILHDQTVVVPGALTTGSGGPHKVFTPYHKAWLSETKQNPDLLDTVPPPEGNDESAVKQFQELFDSKVPELPESKQYKSKEDQSRIRKLWPPGNEAGMARLGNFLNKKVSDYAAQRSEPAKDPSSRLSAYFSSGIVSVREVLKRTMEYNGGKHFNEGDVGVDSWVREIVFREFYRQVMVITPHTAMNLPQNMKFDFVQWVDDEEGWKKWCEGKTGMPFVDAGMRQINSEVSIDVQAYHGLMTNLCVERFSAT